MQRLGIPIDISGNYLEGALTASKEIARHAWSEEWREVSEPLHLCVVAMGRWRSVYHVGIWLDFDGGGVLHSIEGSGVRFDTLGKIGQIGFSMIEFYENALRS